jgi:hypothetical protein
MRAMSPHLPRATLGKLVRPILVINGEMDEIAGHAQPLADLFAHGQAVTVPGRDHMSAVGERRTRQAVMDFFRA